MALLMHVINNKMQKFPKIVVCISCYLVPITNLYANGNAFIYQILFELWIAGSRKPTEFQIKLSQ